MWALAVLTLVVGSFLAIVQTDVKRMLAYSSISHAGFVLVGAEAASERGVAGALFYLLAYTFMVVGSFSVATVVGRRGDADHPARLPGDCPGAARSWPWPSRCSCWPRPGCPLTSGFLAKFYVIGAAVEAESYALALIAMISAVVSAFVYLRIIVAMYMSVEEGDETDALAGAPAIRVPPAAALSLGIALVFTVVVGLVPSPVVDFARDALPVLVSAGP